MEKITEKLRAFFKSDFIRAFARGMNTAHIQSFIL